MKCRKGRQWKEWRLNHPSEGRALNPAPCEAAAAARGEAAGLHQGIGLLSKARSLPANGLAAALPLHAPIDLGRTQPQRCGRCPGPSAPASSQDNREHPLGRCPGCPCTAASEDSFCLPQEGLSWQLNTSPSANKGHYHTRGLNTAGLLCPFHDNVKPQHRRKLCCSCGVSVVPSQPSCSAGASRRRKPARLRHGELHSRVLQRYPLRD